MMKEPLNIAEKRCFEFILTYLDDYKRAPSYAGISEGLTERGFKISVPYAQKLCQGLVEKGWLEFGPVVHSYRDVKVIS